MLHRRARRRIGESGGVAADGASAVADKGGGACDGAAVNRAVEDGLDGHGCACASRMG